MISLKIVTPHGTYSEDDVKSISLRSVEGQMTLLTDHLPIFASLVPCKLALVDNNDQRYEYALSGGFCHLEDNKAMILTDAIEGKTEIDLERAKRAYERAKARIEKKDEVTNLKRAQLALERAVNRINVYGG